MTSNLKFEETKTPLIWKSPRKKFTFTTLPEDLYLEMELETTSRSLLVTYVLTKQHT